MSCLPRARTQLAAAVSALCWTTGAFLYGTPPAAAQVLPQTGSGTDVTVQPMSALLAKALPATSTAPAWQFTPGIGVKEEWTDNALPGAGQPQASLITIVTPTLAVSGQSARITGALTYAPSIYRYNNVPSQNRVGQNFNGNSHVTLLEEEMFLDLRGFAAEQSLNAATPPPGTSPINKQNQGQSYSFSATPYVTHRFGSWGVVQTGVSVSDTVQSALAGNLPGTSNRSIQIGSVQETASFTSGENFGRILSNVNLSAAQESGNGPLRGAYSNTATYQAGYAVSHAITALASVGWEDISYGGGNALRINDATWSAGGKYAPNPDTAITLLYGHQDGVTAASLDASYAPTVRTKLFARYSEGITTSAQELQATLATAQLDPLGNPVDATSGAPLQLTNNFFGTNGSVYKLRSASLTAAWQFDRESLQATVNRQQRTPAGHPTAGTPAGIASTGTYGSLSWQHDLSDALKSSLFGQYGVTDLAGGQTSTTLLVVSAGLNYAFSGTLNGSLQYSYTNSGFSGAVPAEAINLVALGVRKTF